VVPELRRDLVDVLTDRSQTTVAHVTDEQKPSARRLERGEIA